MGLEKSEFEFGGEVSEVAGILVPKLVAKVRLSWVRRGSEYIDAVADVAELAPAGLEERASTNPAIGELIVTGGNAAVQSSDEFYRERIAHIVGAAVADDTRLDEMSLLLGWLEDLSPYHLRVLVDLASTEWTDLDPHDPRQAWVTSRASGLGLSEDTAEQILSDLESRGMLDTADLAAQYLEAKLDGEGKTFTPIQPSALARRILDA